MCDTNLHTDFSKWLIVSGKVVTFHFSTGLKIPLQIQTLSPTRGSTTAEIRGLSPNVAYKIQIKTSSNNQFSEIKELSVTTCT